MVGVGHLFSRQPRLTSRASIGAIRGEDFSNPRKARKGETMSEGKHILGTSSGPVVPGKIREQVECHTCAGTGKTYPEFESLDALLKYALEQPRSTPWHPGWYYNAAGDQIELYLEEVAYHSEWNKHGFSIHRAMDDNRIVGVTITGIIGKLCWEQFSRKAVMPDKKS